MAASNPRDDNRPGCAPAPGAEDRCRPRDAKSSAAGEALERALMDEFLSDRGHTLQSIRTLPAPRREELLRGAAEHASLRLAEIESRAHFVKDLER